MPQILTPFITHRASPLGSRRWAYMLGRTPRSSCQYTIAPPEASETTPGYSLLGAEPITVTVQTGAPLKAHSGVPVAPTRWAQTSAPQFGFLRLSCQAMIAPPAPSLQSTGLNWPLTAVQIGTPVSVFHSRRPAPFTRCA